MPRSEWHPCQVLRQHRLTPVRLRRRAVSERLGVGVVGRITINSPRDLNLWKTHNANREGAQQVKPANFLTLAHPQAHENRQEKV